MSVAITDGQPPQHRSPSGSAPPPRRRVRQDARDALAVAVFSAGASTGLALILTLVLTRIG